MGETLEEGMKRLTLEGDTRRKCSQETIDVLYNK